MTKKTNILLQLVVGAIVGALLVSWHMPPAVRALFQFSPGMRISAVLLVLFSVYWGIAARDSAQAKTSESRRSRQFHLILINGAVLLLVLSIPGLTSRFLPARDYLVVAGLTIQATGILLAVWARRHLGSNWSGEVRIAAEHQLVRSGPYRFVRHPIYTAVLLMYTGMAIVSGQVHAPLALVIVTLAYWRKIRLEEAALGTTFGAHYDVYRSDTWALVPLVF